MRWATGTHHHYFMMITISCRSSCDPCYLLKFYTDTYNPYKLVKLPSLFIFVVSCRLGAPRHLSWRCSTIAEGFLPRKLLFLKTYLAARIPRVIIMADFSSPKKKQKTKFDWTSGDPAVKAALLGWLACIHWRQDPRVQTLPDTPALGRLLASADHSL